MAADRCIYECPNGHTVVIESWDPQEIGRVWCSCDLLMEFQGYELDK